MTHAADAESLQAQSDTTTAYINLASQSCTSDLTGQDLGGRTLVPGVYCFSSSAQLTGALILDAGGDASAVWVFKTGSTLTTASNSSVLLINGAQPCNVFWQIGSSATLGTGTSFVGNILAGKSVILDSTASICGRAFAQTSGAVTLIDNNITIDCNNAAFVGGPTDTGSLGFSGGSGSSGSGSGSQTVPEPGNLTLLGMGLGAGFLLLRKFRLIRYHVPE